MSIIYRMLMVALLLLCGAAAWVYVHYQQWLQQPLNFTDARQRVLEVPLGSNLHRIAADLEAAGVLQHGWLLMLHARFHNQSDHIRAGEYRLALDTTPQELMDKLLSGEVIQHSFTIVEGWTFKQLLEALGDQEPLSHTLADTPHADILALINASEQHPEGLFLAETYHYPRGLSDVDFLRRAYTSLQHLLQQEWRQRARSLPLKTPYEALILASIIEKETALLAERAKIAGVFVRRLKRRMRLETDPAVIYGLGDSFDGNLRRRDLRRDTPYNTYIHRGLPPTPIAISGRSAIVAVMHPEAGDALFFVARGDGSHQFSATYKEHRKAVRKYQLKRRQQPKKKAAGG